MVFELLDYKTVEAFEKAARNQYINENAILKEVMVMSHLSVNFCKQEEMSICTACNRKQQIGCSFYEKSQFADRCMYFIFDEYCDSLKAQMDAGRELRA